MTNDQKRIALHEEIASLRAQLKHLGELSEADHNQLRERAEQLCLVIRTAKDELESHDEAGAYLTLKNSGVDDV